MIGFFLHFPKTEQKKQQPLNIYPFTLAAVFNPQKQEKYWILADKADKVGCSGNVRADDTRQASAVSHGSEAWLLYCHILCDVPEGEILPPVRGWGGEKEVRMRN